MSAQGEYKMTEMFEEEVAKYTNAPYAVAVDSCSNAIFLSLIRVKEFLTNYTLEQ